MPAAGTHQSLRKYLGAIKDGTTVGLARVNSDYKELDVAIVRATNHVERPAKEKNIRAILFAISGSRPRADVAYCIHALAKRLSKTRNWAVALKTLIVIHRALREVYPSYLEELINYGRARYHMLNLSHFKDDSSTNAWDYSVWVRTYALYLEEKLECFRVLKYDVEMDYLKTRDLDTATLLVQLPALQQLLIRLLNCQPQGAALYNLVIRLALSMVVAESTKIYNAISDGTINLVEKFFKMQRHDALNALDIYRRAVQQSEMLKEFYEVCKSIGIKHGEDLTKIEQPQASFLTAMEEYIRDAPRASTFQKYRISREKEQTETKVVPSNEDKNATEEQVTSLPIPEAVKAEAAPIKDKETDLLGLHEESPDAAELDNKNALALAIVPSDHPLTPEDATTGWELALVAVPTSNETSAVAANLRGLDKLTLDSLYNDAIRRLNQRTSYNPWEPASTGSDPMDQPVFGLDPFFASNAVTAPFYVQMAAMAQQQQAFMQHRQMAMMMGQQQIHQPGPNPFGNPFAPVNSNPYEMVVPKSANSYAGFM